MALVEYDLFGEKRDKVKTAIDRLQAFEPQEGYYVADSGGKDSTCVVKLCEMAGVKFDAHYHATTIDPPQLVRFIRKHHPATEIEKPEHTMRELIIKNQMPPTRLMRYCCQHLKELHGQGRVVVTQTTTRTAEWLRCAIGRTKRLSIRLLTGRAKTCGSSYGSTTYRIVSCTISDSNGLAACPALWAVMRVCKGILSFSHNSSHSIFAPLMRCWTHGEKRENPSIGIGRTANRSCAGG